MIPPVPLVSWALFFLWSLWLMALTGWAAGVGSFAPDLALVLLLALESRRPGHRAFAAALLVAAARVALSTDAPLAVVAGYLGAVGGVGLARRVFEVDGPLSRAVFTGLAALGLSFWWRSARWIDLASEGIQLAPPTPAWETALASGLTMLVFSRVLLALPGLSPFFRKPGRLA